LEVQKEFNIIFIQELPWLFIKFIPSLFNRKEDKLVSIPNHSCWINFSKNPSNPNKFLRVIIYINIQLANLCFTLCKDIFNYRDVSCISFFNCGSIYFLLNIYSDLLQSALKYLKDTEVNINNVLIMIGDFNIRNNSWNLLFSYHLIHRDTLTDITDSFQLYISSPTVQVFMRYMDNQNNSNSVIDLMFLRPTSEEFNNYSIHID